LWNKKLKIEERKKYFTISGCDFGKNNPNAACCFSEAVSHRPTQSETMTYKSSTFRFNASFFRRKKW